MDIRIPNGILTVSPEFKVGDMPPAGYLDWHEWAEVQHKAGLRQVECGACGKWQYPQQLSGKNTEFMAKDRRGKEHKMTMALCLICAAKGE